MEQEKDREFKVTDKRSTFRQDSSESENPDIPSEEPKRTEPKSSESAQQSQPQKGKPSDEDSSIPLPEANLLTLMFSLYTHAQISLGMIPDPMSQQAKKDLLQAKYNIDLLGILKQKTRGNLTKEEEQTLEQILYELRMLYVEVSKL